MNEISDLLFYLNGFLPSPGKIRYMSLHICGFWESFKKGEPGSSFDMGPDPNETYSRLGDLKFWHVYIYIYIVMVGAIHIWTIWQTNESSSIVLTCAVKFIPVANSQAYSPEWSAGSVWSCVLMIFSLKPCAEQE